MLYGDNLSFRLSEIYEDYGGQEYVEPQLRLTKIALSGRRRATSIHIRLRRMPSVSFVCTRRRSHTARFLRSLRFFVIREIAEHFPGAVRNGCHPEFIDPCQKRHERDPRHKRKRKREQRHENRGQTKLQRIYIVEPDRYGGSAPRRFHRKLQNGGNAFIRYFQ